MLEGKEIAQKIGDFGEASVDLTPAGKLIIEVTAKKEIDLLAELQKLAAKTETPIDDAVVAAIKKILAAASLLGK